MKSIHVMHDVMCLLWYSTLHHNDVIPDTEDSIDGFSLFCFSLPFILLLMQTTLYHHCNSNVYSLASDKDELQQNSYTIIIVSLMNVPLWSFQEWISTSISYSTPNTTGNLLAVIIILTGIGLVSGYIAAVHVISCDLSRAMQYLWKADDNLQYCFGHSVH